MNGILPEPVKTTCPYCGVGCGVVISPDGNGSAAVTGDTDHPANHGRLCVKGAALGETIGLEGRLLFPTIHRQRATWNQATTFIADGLKRTLEQHGASAIAFYLSGQLLTEDYYVANKFAKGFIGTPHVDTNSRLCMASSVAGHRRAFGSDTVPNTYEDLDEADLIILVGSNAAWCHPVLYQRMQKAREKRGAILVNIDPRVTATSAGADLSLPVAAGMDGVLFSFLLSELARRQKTDRAFIAAHTSSFDAALARAREIAPDLSSVAARTSLSAEDIARFVDLFIHRERVVTCYSQGVNQSAQGTDKVNAILNCHLATGRIGKPGCGPLSLTGQPNAMGGREVGGLANMLAAHMGYTPQERERVARFWGAPHLAEGEGRKAVAMFDAVARGDIKALWVMHTNPAVTMPRADGVRAALKKLDLFVVSEAMSATDTNEAGAHVLLPASAWGEKDGTVTNSERRISRQRPFLPAPGDARPDWEHICLVARRMGYAGFDYGGPAAIFREHAALSAFENDSSRDFDIGAVADIDDAGYQSLTPFHWPWRKGAKPQDRLFAEGGFFSPDGRARFVAISPPHLARRPSAAYPLMLNTGRVRDHWHTMTRTGKAPRLARHVSEPLLALNPDDATQYGLRRGGYARVESAHGSVTLRVDIDPGLPAGMVFAPFHWSAATGGLVRVDAVVQDDVDPLSGQPESKATPVAVVPVAMASEGILLSRRPLHLPAWLQHVRLRLADGEAVFFASTRTPAALQAVLANLTGESRNRASLADDDTGHFRVVSLQADRLETALFVAPQREEALFDWLIDMFARDKLTTGEQKALLAGRTPDAGPDLGPLLCSCFAVRRATISEAFTSGARDVDAIAALTKAGTNCGSCRPEIKALLATMAGLAAAPVTA